MMRSSIVFLSSLVVFVSAEFSGAATFVDSAHGTTFTCNFACHALHGSAGSSLLGASDAQTLCLSCHGPGGVSVKKASIHNPSNLAPSDITCLECHNPHSNRDNYLGGTNIQLIGIQFDYNAEPPDEYAVTKIREETTSGLGLVEDVVFETQADFGRAGDGPCQICHTVGSAGGGDSGVGDFAGHAWGDNCAVCHQHADGFKKRHCVECHDTTATLDATAPKVVTKGGASVSAIGSHLRISGADPIVGLSSAEWTAQCLECHTGHGGDVLIPNNATVGIDYQKTGGIGIGGAATLAGATSEAEICWGCHGAGQSEWNALTDHGFSVTGGDDWTAVSFDLAGTSVPTKTTTSIHSVNATVPEATASSVTSNIDWDNTFGNGVNAIKPAGSKILEAVAEIRCSYCHDVHDLNAANNDTVSGQPYLRGTWLHNPYVATAIERPPESGDSWTGNRWSHFDTGDTVPRLLSDTNGATAGNGSGNAAGGFQIDQNNGYPTATFLNNGDRPAELADTAGLCVLCHGSDIDSIDEFTTRSLWLGSNGHSNASLGGTGSAAVDLFDARNRDGQLSTAMGYFMAGQGADIPNVNKWGDRTPSGFNSKRKELLPYGDNGDRAQPDDGNQSGNSATPPRYTGYYTTNSGSTRATTNLPTNYSAWYSAGGIGTNAGGISGRAHDFSCSKCHTPHASGLPALLVTNCLDYTVSNWSVSASGPKGGNQVTVGPSATNRWAVEVMNNCHRKKDINTGWNVLAPRQ